MPLHLKNSCRLLLFALLGLCLSTAQLHAVQWLPFGPDGGDARRIAPDPRDPNHLFLGTGNGWIYESRNGGRNWRRLALVGKRDDLIVHSIIVDAADSRHLIVGAYFIDRVDGGIYISYDAGVTWLSQAEMRGQSVRSLAAAASDPRTLVAGTLQGVFRSTDGGQRWHLISPQDSTEIHEVQSVAIDPKDPGTIYAGTWHLPWKTTDGGEHWENIKDGIIDDSDVFSIIVDPTSPAIVYASACSGIYKSSSAGLHFDKVQGIPSTARRTRVLLEDPSHRETIFAGTTEGLWRSEDAGHTWTRTTGPEIIVNDVFVDPADSRHILLATDRGGVMASTDGGDTFASSNGGFSARQITALKRDSRHPATLFVGVVNDKEWGGVFQSDNGGIAWSQRSEGLGGRDVFSLGQAADGTIIAGTSHGLYRLASETQTWARIENAAAPLPPTGAADPAVAVAPVLTRAPVTVEPNQFAERKSTRPVTAAQRKSAALRATLHPAARVPLRSTLRPNTKPRAKSSHSSKSKSKSPAHLAPSPRKAQLLAAKKHTATPARPLPARIAATPVPAAAPAAPPPPPSFDGSVYSIVLANRTLLATTSLGLLTSPDDGATWTPAGPEGSADWRLLASARSNVVAATLHALYFSADAGATWTPIKLPEVLTQLTAIAVTPTGELWTGSREGVFVSSDAGITWATPKNLYVPSVNNIFYDEASDRMMVTTGGPSSFVFTVQFPQRQITYADSGWTLRLARPIGDHIIAATLYDGIVVQPLMVPSPMPSSTATTPHTLR